jgi:hypothetical protein
MSDSTCLRKSWMQTILTAGKMHLVDPLVPHHVDVSIRLALHVKTPLK